MRLVFVTVLLPALLAGAMACSQGDFAGAGGKQKGDDKGDDDDDDDDGDDDAGDGQDGGGDDSGTADDDDGADDDDEDGGIDGSDSDADLGTESKDDILAAVDTACATKVIGLPPIAPPSDNLPKTAPNDCRNGIEFNNYERKAFKLNAKGGVREGQTPLEIDVASYTASDHMKLIAETETGDRVVMDTCRLRTASYVDPTGGGKTRPPEDSIREFRIKLPKKTKALRFDFSDATSPTYMRVIGLCDFELTAVEVDGRVPDLRPVSD